VSERLQQAALRPKGRRALAAAAVNIVVIAALVAIPLFFEPFRVTQFTQILVVALAVMGLNLLTGFTGQISVGHSAFFGFGAYSVGVIMASTDAPMPVALAVGTAVGALAGAVIGLPSLRIKDTSLAIVTLVFGASFPALVNLFSSVTGGTQGLRVERITPADGAPFAADQTRYYVVLAAVLVVAGCVLLLDRSRTGRELRALGDNEIAAVTFGVNAPRLRIGVFTASAAITALAGGLFAVTNGFISSGTSFVTILGSIEFLTALVIGGRAILLGPLLGAAIAQLLPAQLGQESPELAHLVYGLVLIVILLLAPGGITGLRPTTWLPRRHPSPLPPSSAPPAAPPTKGSTA
jgi:branched-chain amino acid transport system permease protein